MHDLSKTNQELITENAFLKQKILELEQEKSERKRVERELHKQETKLSSIFRAAPIGMGMIVDRVFQEANEMLCRMTGYSREELLGEDALLLYPTREDYDYAGQEKDRQIREEGTGTVETRWKKRDGTVIDIILSSTPLNPDDLGEGITFTALDVTDRKRVDEAIIKAKKEWEMTFAAIPDMIAIIGADHRILRANKAMASRLGSSAAQVEGCLCYEVVHGLSAPPDYCPHAKMLATGKEAQEVAVEDRRGGVFDVSTTPLYDDAGRLIGGVHVAREVTTRKETEEALQESEQTLRAFFDAVHESMVLIDTKGTVLLSNPVGASRLGKDVSELVGTCLYDHFPSDVAKYRKEHYDKAILTEKSIYFEDIRADRFFEQHCFPIFGKDQKVSGVAISAREITSRKQAERMLMESEERYRAIFNNAPLGVVHFDADGIVRNINDKFARIIGAPKERILGFSILDGLRDEAMIKAVKDALNGGLGRYEGDYSSVVGATTTPIRAVYQSIITKDETSRGVVGIFEDITGYKHAEEERKRLAERLQRAEKMEALGLLAGGVAHDLNNVLGILIGYSELLLNKIGESNPIRSYATTIMDASGRAAAIIQDMLTLARRGVQAREAVDLNALVLNFMKTLEFEKMSAFHPGVKTRLILDPELLHIMGAPIQLDMMIMNLVSNAAEAMPDGGLIEVKTSNQYLDRPVQGYDEIREGDYVVLSVSDCGEGIPAKNIKHIFEPFYTKKVMGKSGTGLGLTVVWGSVKDHHGYIDVRSEERIGSTFTLYFPVTREGLSAEPISISLLEYMGHGETILVVDDIEGQRNLAAEMLERLNYKVTVSASGEEAVAYLKEHKVNLMVLDMIMDPGMDGLDTYRNVLATHPQQKAIIVSGFSETSRVNETQALGAGPYVKKPYVIEKLGLAVRKELDLGK